MEEKAEKLCQHCKHFTRHYFFVRSAHLYPTCCGHCEKGTVQSRHKKPNNPACKFFEILDIDQEKISRRKMLWETVFEMRKKLNETLAVLNPEEP